MVLNVGQPHCSARPWHDDLRQPFGEELARASSGGTAKPPYVDAQSHDAPVARQIGQDALIMAVYPLGRDATEWTGRARGSWTAHDNNAVWPGQDLLDQQACRDQRRKAAMQLNTE
jgi:hypothetical protein